MTHQQKERISFIQNKEIVARIGKRYNLTEEESLLLYAQYWQEFVVKGLSSLEYVGIIIYNLCTFNAQPYSVKVLAEKEQELLKQLKLKELYEKSYRKKYKRSSSFPVESKRILVKDAILLHITNKPFPKGMEGSFTNGGLYPRDRKRPYVPIGSKDVKGTYNRAVYLQRKERERLFKKRKLS